MIMRVAALAALMAVSSCLAPARPAVPAPAAEWKDPAAITLMLDSLVTAEPAPMAGYSRERFKHWTTGPGHCDTREQILARDGRDVVTDPADCRVLSGTWTSVYDDKQVSDPRALDIDHMVPLAEAWRSGAHAWTDPQRQTYANDPALLLAVSAASNRSKGDQSPATWRPPARGYWCEYAGWWVRVKTRYALTATAAEKTALRAMRAACPV